jgi:MFS family permease
MALFAGMLYPANATSMSRICPPGIQVKGFALNRLANNLGATIGPAIGGILALSDYRLLFWADGLTSLAAAGVFVLVWRGAGLKSSAGTPDSAGEGGVGSNGPDGQSEERAEEPGSSPGSMAAAPVIDMPRSPWRDWPFLLLMLIFLLWSAVFIQILTTFPLYMRDVYGLAENRIGQLFAVNTVLIVLLEMILMEKIRKYPLTRMINLSFILLGLGFGLMPLGRGFAFAGLSMAILTFGEMLSMPLVTALIAGRADDATRGRYMGMFSFSFSLAFIISPAAGTAIYQRFGGDAVWVVCAAVCLLLAAAFSALRPHLQ